MNTSAVQVYYTQCFNLAKTLCIKSEDSANAINSLLILTYGEGSVDLNNPASWKYYLNISGQYHATDTPMYVTSLDNLQTIEFTVANLQNNPATLQAYQYGTRYYYSLLNEYPDQEQLILGILYPCDINTAIAAKPWTILSYPQALVETQEITLIDDLQTWIYNYQSRWNVKAFFTSDSFYQIAQHAIFYLNLLPKLINLRVKNCKTFQAHSFHIQQYLASHEGLDVYIQYMTQEQIMYLYRNILYIERHPGWQQTFKNLVDVLLTKRSIPLSEYYVRLMSLFGSDYKAQLSFDRVSVNTVVDTGSKNNYTYADFVNKTIDLAPGNTNLFNANSVQIEQKIQNARSDSMLTKDLESSMYDYSDAVPHTLTDILMNEWLYLASTSQYQAIVNFTDPTTLVNYSLSALDAFHYLAYLFMKASGVTPLIFPVMHVQKVLKPTKPTLAQMTALTDASYSDAPVLAQFFLNQWPASQSAYSINSFFSVCASIFELGLSEWYQIAGNGDMYHRAELWNMADFQYQDAAIKTPYTGASIAQWLTSRALIDPDANSLQIRELITAIWETGTGLNLYSQFTFEQVQKAMLKVLGLLSSYSIQFIQNINPTPIVLLNWAAIRAGNKQVSVDNEIFVIESVYVLDASASSDETVDFGQGSSTGTQGITDLTVNPFEISIGHDVAQSFLYTQTYPVVVSPFWATISESSPMTNSNYATLTASQANALVDVYQSAVE
jgi:hypothetical protein